MEEHSAKEFKKAAKNGDAAAQNHLGLCYVKGLGVKQNYGKAREWFLKAAAQGHAGAMLNVGACYEGGRGVEQNLQKALDWYETAAIAGNKEAQKRAKNLRARRYRSNEFEFDGTVLKKYKGEQKEVVIPLGVTEIGKKAFKECGSIENVKIPNSVTRIGGWAFSHCKSLKSIEIPKSVTRIGKGAFYACESLKSIEVESDNPSFSSVDGNLYSKDKKTLIRYAPAQKKTSFTVPNSVTSIGGSAFWGCESLESIKISNSVTSIEEHAFRYCKSLKSIEVEADNPSFLSVDGNLYGKDKKTLIRYAPAQKKTSFTVPNSVMSIGEGAFAFCGSLKSIDIPNSVTSIARSAFAFCESLESIKIPNSVTSIEGLAFWCCESLKEIHYPGTRAQWRAVKKDMFWDSNTGKYTVICADEE